MIFVPLDSDEEAFNDYYTHMPWLSLPMSAERQALQDEYAVTGIPHLTVLDGKTGDVITHDGMEHVTDDPVATLDQWGITMLPAELRDDLGNARRAFQGSFKPLLGETLYAYSCRGYFDETDTDEALDFKAKIELRPWEHWHQVRPQIIGLYFPGGDPADPQSYPESNPDVERRNRLVEQADINLSNQDAPYITLATQYSARYMLFALPFGNQEKELAAKYGIDPQGDPHLIIVEPDGTLITSAGLELLHDDPSGNKIGALCPGFVPDPKKGWASASFEWSQGASALHEAYTQSPVAIEVVNKAAGHGAPASEFSTPSYVTTGIFYHRPHASNNDVFVNDDGGVLYYTFWDVRMKKYRHGSFITSHGPGLSDDNEHESDVLEKWTGLKEKYGDEYFFVDPKHADWRVHIKTVRWSEPGHVAIDS